MSKPVIIGINPIASTVSIALRYGCLSVSDTATLSVSEQACEQFDITCVPATACKAATYIKTPKASLTMLFPYVGKDGNGKATFSIPSAFKTSIQRYWKAEMSMCGRTVKVQLQKTGEASVQSFSTSALTGLVDFESCGQIIGKVATIASGCMAPDNWMILGKCGGSTDLMVASTTPKGAFSIPQYSVSGVFFIAPSNATEECLREFM